MIKMCYVALMGTSTEVFIGHVFWWKKKRFIENCLVLRVQ